MIGRRALLVAGAALVGTLAGVVVLYDATSFRPQSGPQTGGLALVGATVLAGDSLSPVTEGVVLIRDGVITEVGTASEVTPPAEAEVIDLSGYTLVPGLIDLPEIQEQTIELRIGKLHESFLLRGRRRWKKGDPYEP